MYFMRHGATQDDVLGLWSGWDDIDLLPEAIQVVTQSAYAISNLGIRRIVCSSIQRAKHSAQIVADILQVPLELDWRLAPWKLGILEKQVGSADKIQPYVDDPFTPVPDGEALNYYKTRFMASMNDAWDRNNDTGPTLVVAHSSGAWAWEFGDGDIEHMSGAPTPGTVVLANKGSKYSVIHGELITGDEA
jgi:broad specificity phosphatase PhoE